MTQNELPKVSRDEVMGHLHLLRGDQISAEICFSCEDVKIYGGKVCDGCNNKELQERAQWDIKQMDKLRAFAVLGELENIVAEYSQLVDIARDIIENIKAHHIKDEGDYCLSCQVKRGGTGVYCEGCPLS